MLSVPVQVIAWKDSSPKWSVMCRAGHKTQPSHSLTRMLLIGHGAIKQLQCV